MSNTPKLVVLSDGETYSSSEGAFVVELVGTLEDLDTTEVERGLRALRAEVLRTDDSYVTVKLDNGDKLVFDRWID